MTKSIVILKRSEVSKNPSTNTQNLLDISVCEKPQYDKAIVIASKSQDLRGKTSVAQFL